MSDVVFKYITVTGIYYSEVFRAKKHFAFLASMVMEKHQVPEELWEGMTTAIIQSPRNSYFSFVILPDGSKEGKSFSEDMDVVREQFMSWMDRQNISGSNFTFMAVNMNNTTDKSFISHTS
jgi:hypothetical protein